jgi:hypothetical protein
MELSEPLNPLHLVRRGDAGQQLTKFIVWSQIAGQEFDWSVINCAAWAAKAVEVQVVDGYDLFAPFRGHTDDPAEAYKAIKKAGFEDMSSVITTQFYEVPLAFAHKGDIVFVKDVEGDDNVYEGLGMSEAIGIADPPFFWALGRYGLGKGLLFQQCSRAFTIEVDG